MHRATVTASTLFFCAIAVFGASCRSTNHATGARSPTPSTVPEISDDALRAHVMVLADDSMQGRGTATTGYLQSAKYVAAQFAAIGLKPAIDGQWYQSVPLRQQSISGNRGKLSFASNNASTNEFQRGQSFVVTRPGSAEIGVNAQVVFVGYGITMPGGQYDDYKGLDVHGKFVAFLPGAPAQLSLDARTFYAGSKEKNAQDHGAIGTLRLWTPAEDKVERWSQAVFKYQDAGAFSFAVNEPSPQRAEHIWLGPDASKALFESSAVTYEHATTAAAPFALSTTLRISVTSAVTITSSPNVVALIPGTDPVLKHEYVVISAHLDHLGIGRAVNGDSIYNGAVDNAAGVATLIEVARARLRMNVKSRRSILFVAFTGEEPGGLGSEYFVHHSPVPLSSIVANINLDAVSVWDYDGIVPRGAEHSSLSKSAEDAVALTGARVVPDPIPGKTSLAQSDQYAFMTSGVPAVIPAAARSGKAREDALAWVNTRYHQPSDDLQQPFDYTACARFARVILSLTYVLAQQNQRPVWDEASFFRQFSTRQPLK